MTAHETPATPEPSDSCVCSFCGLDSSCVEFMIRSPISESSICAACIDSARDTIGHHRYIQHEPAPVGSYEEGSHNG